MGGSKKIYFSQILEHFLRGWGLIYVYTLWFHSIFLHPVPVIYLQSPQFTWKCVTRKAVEEGGGTRQKGRRRSLLCSAFCLFAAATTTSLAWEAVKRPREHVPMAM